MAGAAGGLKNLKESDKSCNGVLQHAMHLGKPRAADSYGCASPPTPHIVIPSGGPPAQNVGCGIQERSS